MATGISVVDYLVQQVTMTEYDPGPWSVCERVPCAAMTEYDPGHWSVCERVPCAAKQVAMTDFDPGQWPVCERATCVVVGHDRV